MGAGEAFRMVAQSLMGAGGGAAQYALDRDAELRKQQMLLEALAAQKKGGLYTPLEEKKILAEINALNRRDNGDGGTATDRRIDELIQQEEISRGYQYTPQQRAKRKSELLGLSLFKPRIESVETDTGLPKALQPIPLLPNQGGAPFNWMKSAPQSQVTPDPTSLPPRNPGETPAQYTARTGIKIKSK